MESWFLDKMVVHLTYGVNQVFIFVEIRSPIIFLGPILLDTCATCYELPSNISTISEIIIAGSSQP